MKRTITYFAVMLLLVANVNAQVRLVTTEEADTKATFNYNVDGKLNDIIVSITDEDTNEQIFIKHNYRSDEVTTRLFGSEEQAKSDFAYITKVSKLENGLAATDKFMRFTSGTPFFEVSYSYDNKGNMSKAGFNLDDNSFTYIFNWTDGNISKVDVMLNGVKAGDITFEYNDHELNNDFGAMFSPHTMLTTFNAMLSSGVVMAGYYGNLCKNYMTAVKVNLPPNLFDDEIVGELDSDNYAYEYDESGLPISLLSENTNDKTTILWAIPASINNHTAKEDASTACYSIDGKRLALPQRGINIMRQSNGKTKKTLVR